MVVAAICQVAQADKLVKNTADYYKTLADKFIDQDVKLEVASVDTPNQSVGETVPGHRLTYANTYNNGMSGGYIYVAVPKESVEALVKKYGLRYDYGANDKPRTKTLVGKLCRTPGGMLYVLYKDPASKTTTPPQVTASEAGKPPAANAEASSGVRQGPTREGGVADPSTGSGTPRVRPGPRSGAVKPAE